jgi:hypothetical protein
LYSDPQSTEPDRWAQSSLVHSWLLAPVVSVIAVLVVVALAAVFVPQRGHQGAVPSSRQPASSTPR